MQGTSKRTYYGSDTGTQDGDAQCVIDVINLSSSDEDNEVHTPRHPH